MSDFDIKTRQQGYTKHANRYKAARIGAFFCLVIATGLQLFITHQSSTKQAISEKNQHDSDSIIKSIPAMIANIHISDSIGFNKILASNGLRRDENRIVVIDHTKQRHLTSVDLNRITNIIYRNAAHIRITAFGPDVESLKYSQEIAQTLKSLKYINIDQLTAPYGDYGYGKVMSDTIVVTYDGGAEGEIRIFPLSVAH